MAKKAFLTGLTGQDGSYLAELLLEKGYEVHGLMRRASTFNTGRIEHLFPAHKDKRLFTYWGDLSDSSNLNRLIASIKPDEIYNLGAQSHVRISFDVPESTAEVDAIGVIRLLDAIRAIKPDARFYQASTSELYGLVQETPQRETTPFYPRSPYAAAKLYAYWITVNYREAYGLYACNGILFNHESPRRGDNFVTRKITLGVSAIARGRQERIVLGNLDAKRDWGYAKEYVEGMWLMLQQDTPEDFVLATGRTTTVREFVEKSFAYAGKRISWKGSGVDEKGVDQDGTVRVAIDPEYFRPTEVDLLLGDPSKARRLLGWEAKVGLDELVAIMMRHDLGEDGRG